MATVTPNYSWPVPTSTDYVKDGATAIEALGDAIDATVFGLPKPGLTLINTTSFSGVATVTVNNVFTTTYDTYRIVLNGFSATTSSSARMRLCIAGTPTLGTGYFTAVQRISYAAVSAPTGTSATSTWYIGEMATDTRDLVFDIQRPALATYKTLSMIGSDNGGTFVGAALSTASSLHDGFRLFNDGGHNMNGTVRIYGYRNTV
jgi:hypothetical protein